MQSQLRNNIQPVSSVARQQQVQFTHHPPSGFSVVSGSGVQSPVQNSSIVRQTVVETSLSDPNHVIVEESEHLQGSSEVMNSEMSSQIDSTGLRQIVSAGTFNAGTAGPSPSDSSSVHPFVLPSSGVHKISNVGRVRQSRESDSSCTQK